MALVAAVRNADGTYTVTLSQRADDALRRWGDQSGRNRANQLEDALTNVLRSKINEFRAMDGPGLAERYDAMTTEQKAIVDPVFAAVIVAPD